MIAFSSAYNSKMILTVFHYFNFSGFSVVWKCFTLAVQMKQWWCQVRLRNVFIERNHEITFRYVIWLLPQVSAAHHRSWSLVGECLFSHAFSRYKGINHSVCLCIYVCMVCINKSQLFLFFPSQDLFEHTDAECKEW